VYRDVFLDLAARGLVGGEALPRRGEALTCLVEPGIERRDALALGSQPLGGIASRAVEALKRNHAFEIFMHGG